MSELTKEQIEEVRRRYSHGMDYEQDTMNALCDLALSALSRPIQAEMGVWHPNFVDGKMTMPPDAAGNFTRIDRDIDGRPTDYIFTVTKTNGYWMRVPSLIEQHSDKAAPHTDAVDTFHSHPANGPGPWCPHCHGTGKAAPLPADQKDKHE